MKITLPSVVTYRRNSPDLKKSESSTVEIKPVAEVSYPKVSPLYFGAAYNVVPKGGNIDLEIGKLLKQISNIMENEVGKFDADDYATRILQKLIGEFRYKMQKQQNILEQIQQTLSQPNLNLEQKQSIVNQLRKEFNLLAKIKSKPEKPKKVEIDDKTDFQLINKLKSAVSKGDFNLPRIYKEYYSGLNGINNLEELAEVYPKIKVPPRPENVIAKKFTDTLTRDFYEQFDRLIVAQKKDAVFELSDSFILKALEDISSKYDIDKDALYIRLANSIHEAIIKKYSDLKFVHGFSAVPEQRKVKSPQVTITDLKLLAVNYDDFVLSVLKNQYVEGKKASEIVYEDRGLSISLSSLASSEYKFEKPSEKIKHIVSMGDKIEAAKRNYDRAGIEDLKARLAYYSGTEIGNNEEILERIILFDSCRFAPEDIKALGKFLSHLDNIHDGKLSLKEGVSHLTSDDFKPKGTEILNEIERKKAAEAYKLEQQRVFRLNSLQDSFDESINILYKNDMTGIAGVCLKYRPNSLDPVKTSNAEYLSRLITESANGDAFNKTKLEAAITRWDTYNYYRNNDADNPMYRQAIALYRLPDGSVDKNRAGQHIINSELVNNYPESLSFVRNPEILERIMEKSPDKDFALGYLSKYDDYIELLDSEKSKVSSLMRLFDSKDVVEKFLLKSIIENDYVKTSTRILAKINDKGSETVAAVIAPSAKQQILSKYKYPTCMDYFKGFEDALSSFASAWGSSGIKRTGTNNNAIEYKMELKLKGHDDRLFSSGNDYTFDIFSDRGLH